MMRLLLWILVGFAAIIEAQITSPSSGTVWVNGNNAIITWGSISGTEFSIVLTRMGTVYHHTITSTAPNTGSFSWVVDIPSTDGWPTSTSSDMVYEIDFYVNGGWNNGGTLVASSQEFAIQYTGSSDPAPVTVTSVDPPPVFVTTIINPPPADPTTITVFSPAANGGFITTIQTEVIVGITTLTTVITAVYQVGTPNPTNTVIVTTTLPPPVITVTITNTQQLSPTTTDPTTNPTTDPTTSTTFVTTYIGATTIGSTVTPTTNPAAEPLYNSAAAKVAHTMWLSVVAMLSFVVIVFI
jgi:hypothetical protein